MTRAKFLPVRLILAATTFALLNSPAAALAQTDAKPGEAKEKEVDQVMGCK